MNSYPQRVKLTYQVKPNPRTTENKYFDIETKRTYFDLYSYYLPDNLVGMPNYFSPTYLKTYTDGYGYNFYYGGTGYYEYTVLPIRPLLNEGGEVVGVYIVGGVVTFCFLLCCMSLTIASHTGCCDRPIDDVVTFDVQNGATLNVGPDASAFATGDENIFGDNELKANGYANRGMMPSGSQKTFDGAGNQVRDQNMIVDRGDPY